MKEPVVSVIITCYNLGQYLEEALENLADFCMEHGHEIIIVDDGSTDQATIATLETIGSARSEIKILRQENLGLGKARNNGIAMASGKYIIPLDADNKLRTVFLTESARILEMDPDIGVVHGDACFFGAKSGIWKVKPFEISEMVRNNYIDACACFRKSDWLTMGGYDESMPVMGFEDWDLWLRMGVKGYRFRYVDEVFFDYRVREHSMLTDAWSKRQQLIDYIFGKKELGHLLAFRMCLIENDRLKQEPAFKEILRILYRKFKRKLKQ